jgi:hypothetical protein
MILSSRGTYRTPNSTKNKFFSSEFFFRKSKKFYTLSLGIDLHSMLKDLSNTLKE